MKFLLIAVSLIAVAVAGPITPVASPVLVESAVATPTVVASPALVDSAVAAPAVVASPALVGSGIAAPAIVASPALIEAVAQPGIVASPALIESFEPISVGPAIIDSGLVPIETNPAFIPIHDGGAVTAIEEITPAVVPATEAVSADTPIVQLIININSKPLGEPITVGPAVSPVEPVAPVQVVDSAFEPVNVVDHAPIQPVAVAEPVLPVPVVPLPEQFEPVIVVDHAPIQPIAVAQPVLPAPAVTLPEQLN